MSDPEDGHGEPGPWRSIEAAQGLVHLPGIYNSFGDLVFYYASTDEPRYLLIANQKAEAARMFQAAVATGVTSLFEYASAKAELRRLAQ